MAKKNAVLILIIFAVTFSYLNLSAKSAHRILGTLQSTGSSALISTPVYFADNRQAEEPLAHRLLAQVFPQTFGGQTQSQHLPQTQTQKQTQSQTQSQTQTQQTQTLYIGFPLQVSWRYKTNGPIIAQPQTDATSVFIAAKSGIVHRVTQTQGAVMWKVNVGDAIEDAFVLDQGIIYVGTQNGLMLALQSTTGKEIWLQHMANESFLTAPALDKTSICYAGIHGTVVCLNRADGQILWKFKMSGACHVSPYILDNTLYAGSDDRYLYAIDKTAGFVRWKFQADAPILGAPIATDGAVFFGSEDGYFYCLKIEKGEQRWRYKAGGSIRGTPMFYYNERKQKVEDVLFASLDNFLYDLDVKDGGRRWLSGTTARIYNRLRFDRALVFATPFGPTIFGFDPHDGERPGNFTTNSRIRSSPMTGNDRLFVGLNDGHLVCLTRKPPETEEEQTQTQTQTHTQPQSTVNAPAAQTEEVNDEDEDQDEDEDETLPPIQTLTTQTAQSQTQTQIHHP